MTLRHLQIFSCVCRQNSITAAAEKLGITQPAVSIAIKELEAMCGTPLFERIGRGIFLTEKGRVLRRYSDTILSQYDEAVSLVRDERGIVRFSLGVNISAAETLLPRIMELLKSEIPDVDVRLSVSNSGQIENQLTANEIDIAVMDSVAPRDDLRSTLVYNESMELVCAPEYFDGDSITFDELAHKKLLLRENGSGSRSCLDAVYTRNGKLPNIAAESMSTIALIDMARCGMGFTILPRILADDVCSGRLKKVVLSDESLKRSYYLVYYKKKYFSEKMKSFVALVENKGL